MMIHWQALTGHLEHEPEIINAPDLLHGAHCAFHQFLAVVTSSTPST
jgi:hypothetical protein